MRDESSRSGCGRKLIAWMDGELPDAEAQEIALHVKGCGDCRGQVQAYRRASAAFDSYCAAAGEAAKPPRQPRRRLAVAVGAAAVVALSLALPWLRWAQRAPAGTAAQAETPVIAASTAATAATTDPATPVTKPARMGRLPSRATSQAHSMWASARMRHPQLQEVKVKASASGADAVLFASEPAVEVMIPAAAVFPPGAVPDGLSFAAEIRVSADGTAREVRLWPQMTGAQTIGFETGGAR